MSVSCVHNEDTICALATPSGSSAIAVIRVSGMKTLSIISSLFHPARGKKDLAKQKTHTIHLGTLEKGDEVIDEVLVSLFREPASYTGEDSVEISCHGSEYIQQRIIEALLEEGARLAGPGEFTMRAFMNGKFDLSQAEAVADLITSNSRAAHDLALSQMRGGYSQRIRELRQQLVHLASLLELELDFSEEDVEFADREKLQDILHTLEEEITRLIQSFRHGNVLKKGIPVAITGKPNVGKSTLLNAILNEEKAIVSEIPGTTRDAIEDTIILEGIAFRFIDTAGLRDSGDQVESIGVERTYDKIRTARIILFLFDVSDESWEDITGRIREFREDLEEKMSPEEIWQKKILLIGNKIDKLVEIPRHFRDFVEMECLFVSAKRKENINMISDSLLRAVHADKIGDDIIVSNMRHHEALTLTLQALHRIREGMVTGLPSDLLAIDLRDALHHLGTITGEVTNDEILGNIFGNFCIGK
ncbi:MAG: tRNA uridine-5-carboxymethylaminomethyl(34) synthesis GTPase MnmE [Bacteroidales bacterium]